MPYQNYNPNPMRSRVGDCTVRALSKALGLEWDDAFAVLVAEAFRVKDMPSADAVWGAVLRNEGFHRKGIPDTCPECYTVRQFAEDHPEGIYVVATDRHVLTVADGDFFDTWDSGDETPLYYYEKR
jgi:hypothetical protein